MTDKKKLGFDGQWIDGTPIGDHVDSDGDPIKIDTAFLEAVVSNYDPKLHEAPAVIGHPTTDAPAYGHVVALRVANGRLERQFSEVSPQFEELVRSGAYKKRSDAFYLDPEIAPGGKAPYLRHVGFLGAQPPAIKGIQDIHFAEGDAEVKTVDVEVDTAISFSEEGEQMKDEDVKKTAREAVGEFFRDLFKSKDAAPATAAFSEADQKTLIDKAVAAAEAKFSEPLKEANKKIEELTTQVASQTGSSQRAAIVAFCESLPATILPAMKKMGIVGFMEALDAIPEKKKITVITFAEEGDKQVEKKVEISPLTFFQNFLKALPPFVTFGEKFGDVKLTGDGGEIANPGRMAAMRAEAGIKQPEAAAAK